MHKTWFVTGAASRLGADIVKAALVQGDRVFATDGDGAALVSAFVQARCHGVADELQLRPLDVADGRAVNAALADAIERFGGVDVVVHAEPLRQDGGTRARWPDSALVRGLFNVTRAALPSMRERRGGRIHHLVPPLRPGAGPSLFSIAGFCAAVAADVADAGITVNAVAPCEAHVRLFAPWSQGADHLLEQA
ncbi:MAG TPA: SDR family NAD(P)-dependent oxidoreductase [Burkholderiaceae bacterium]|jgi:NAD(P)-dependent dehydrogenase (short-subunit alcohol dehydrogenase family)|nr:SDR family NAD(P)-dependent oxidoreductase [Burkholderiaceae bacterium]